MITKENVEETIEKALDVYEKQGMIIDVIFWRNCIELLKEKYSKMVFKE